MLVDDVAQSRMRRGFGFGDLAQFALLTSGFWGLESSGL